MNNKLLLYVTYYILYNIYIFILYIISNKDLILLSVFRLCEKGRQQHLIALFFLFSIPENCSISFFCCKLFVRNIRANIFIAGEEFPAKKREPIGKQQQQIQQKKLPSINEQRLRPCWIPGIIKQSNTRIHKGSPLPLPSPCSCPSCSSCNPCPAYLCPIESQLVVAANWSNRDLGSASVSGQGSHSSGGSAGGVAERGLRRCGCRACSFLPATHLLNTIGLRLQLQLQPGHNTFGYNFTWLELRLRLGLGLGTADWGLRTGDCT